MEATGVSDVRRPTAWRVGDLVGWTVNGVEVRGEIVSIDEFDVGDQWVSVRVNDGRASRVETQGGILREWRPGR